MCTVYKSIMKFCFSHLIDEMNCFSENKGDLVFVSLKYEGFQKYEPSSIKYEVRSMLHRGTKFFRIRTYLEFCLIRIESIEILNSSGSKLGPLSHDWFCTSRSHSAKIVRIFTQLSQTCHIIY